VIAPDNVGAWRRLPGFFSCLFCPVSGRNQTFAGRMRMVGFPPALQADAPMAHDHDAVQGVELTQAFEQIAEPVRGYAHRFRCASRKSRHWLWPMLVVQAGINMACRVARASGPGRGAGPAPRRGDLSPRTPRRSLAVWRTTPPGDCHCASPFDVGRSMPRLAG
jgi:hypothetical protein